MLLAVNSCYLIKVILRISYNYINFTLLVIIIICIASKKAFAYNITIVVELFQCVFRHLLINSYIAVVSPQGSVSILPPGNVLTNFNSTVSLACGALGGPNNMFEWSKQGVTVSNSDVLELTMITGSDGGVYQCTVTNDAGSDTASNSVIGMYLINFLLFRYISCLFCIILLF